MAGVLAFTLGLENAEFIEKLGISERVMVSLEVGVEALKTIFEKCWQAIEKGAALNNLHERTGESVSGLYQLQEAFKAVDIGAEAVGGMLFKTQKFLGGVTEEGEKTDEILGRMGLTLDGLRKMDAGKTFSVVAEALHKLDRSSAANIAGKLYGREGAGNMIQIANSADQFATAMAHSAKDAQIWQAAAPAFDEISLYVGIIAGHLNTFWAGIAAGAAPAILKVEKALEKIDFGAIGKKFGKVIDSFANIIQAGQLGGFLELTFETAIQETSNFFLAVIVGWESALGSIAMNFGGNLTSAIVNGIANAMPAFLGIAAYIANPAVMGPMLKATFAALAKQAKDQNPFEAFAAGFKSVESAMPHDRLERLNRVIKAYGTVPAPEEKEAKKEKPPESTNTEHDKPRFTELEKIGFVINSGGSRNDHASNTAKNTKDTAQATATVAMHAERQTELLGQIKTQLANTHTNRE